MSPVGTLTRRGVLQAGVALGGGLWVGVCLPVAAASVARVFRPNAWLRITPDNKITFIVDRAEMGQGVMTALPMLLAEELEVEPGRLLLEFAPVGRVYDNPDLGMQLTGGSTSVKTSYRPLREAGATARELLRSAAALRWKVPVAECVAAHGEIVHPSLGLRATYGSLCEAAALLEPATPVLKKPEAFRVIGQSLDRLDARRKVDGSGQYGLDVKLPGLKVAVVVRCPVFGGTARAYDDKAARAVAGVEDVVPLSTGIAVVASGYWEARQGAEQLSVQWNEGPNATLSSDGIRERYRKLCTEGSARVARRSGDLEKGMAAAARTVQAVYELPYLAHATMEPQNATARVTEDACEVWAPTQGVGLAARVAQQVTGLSLDQITVHQTLLGGGFGRRIAQDYVAEAVQLSKLTQKPVKVVFSREDDIQHDVYRPAMYSELTAGLDAAGHVTAWKHRVVGQSIVAQIGPQFIAAIVPAGIPSGLKSVLGSVGASLVTATTLDQSSVEGANTFAYALENVLVDSVTDEPGVPVGFWRSVGHSHNAFVVESFVDELAHAARKDPFEFRRGLLARAHRNRGVLELAAKEAGWGTPLPPGICRGIAQHQSFGSFVAMVAEVVIDGDEINVRRVVVAVDCGIVVNPELVRAQMESSVIFGLSAALKGKITIANGRVEQGNFNDYEVVRFHEAPKIEVHLIHNQAPPSGVGEPGVPPIAPAVANAVFAATGKRLRKLPLSFDG